MREVWAKSASDGRAGSVPPSRVKPRLSAPSGKSANRMASAALARLPLGVAVIDADARLVYWNEQAAGLFGVPPLMATGLPALHAILAAIPRLTPQQRDRIVTFCATHIEAGDRTEPESFLRLSLARDHRLAIQIRGIGNRRWMLVIDDGSNAAATGRTVATAGGDAWVDPLTGLSNRRHFNRILADRLAGDGPDARHTVLVIDLDRFTSVNDTFGRPIGDALLCLVAERLRREVRDDDLVGRLGGDEFVVLIRSGDRAEPLAARVVANLAHPFLVEGHIAHIGASIGIAEYTGPDITADELMRCAELALYDAKTVGRGTWRFFDSARAARAQGRRDMETGLRKAVAMGELSLVFQLQLNIRTQALTGAEALLRWHHPTFGDVSPDIFIPLAEETGCIVELREWALRTACQEATAWPLPLSVAVKVSARQLDNSDRLAATVQAALQASGLAPGRLELEIVDSAMLSKETHVLDTLHRLHEAGVHITMDNFGTSAAPASFPFDRIKLDRSFVADLGDDVDAVAAARAGIAPDGGDHAPQGQDPWLTAPIGAAEINAFLRRFVPAPDNIPPPR